MDTILMVLGVLLFVGGASGVLAVGWKQASAADRLEAKRRTPLSPEAKRALTEKLAKIAQRRLKEVA